jgi:hypothetical protein
MHGFVIHPEHARVRIPGQVPRLDRTIDRMFAMPTLADVVAQADAPPAPVLRADRVADGLGLPAQLERNLTTFIRHEAPAATNEVDFRRAVMSQLFSVRLDSALRRAVMSRAVSYYRNTAPSASSPVPTFTLGPSRLRNRAEDETKKAARGGRYHRRIPKAGGGYEYVYDAHEYEKRPDAHVDGSSAQREYLQGAVRRLVAAHADGCPLAELESLVARYGAKAVGGAARAIGVRLEKDRLFLKAIAPCLCCAHGPVDFVVMTKAVEQLPSAAGGGPGSVAAPKGPGGGMPSAKKLPPGARRIWHNRIVEKLPDEKWHVVGHVAGLEDPKRVKPLEHDEISPEHLRDLIRKIRVLQAHEAENGAK